MTTDAERKKRNAADMANAISDTIRVVEVHEQHIAKVCDRYRDEPGFWERITALGFTEQIAARKELLRR